MARYPQFIDNTRTSLADTLRQIAPSYKKISIATGYWDLAGTMEIIDQIENYDEIRLLIGKEPLAHRLQVKYNLDPNAPENLFPDADIAHDLEEIGTSSELNKLRDTVKKLMVLLQEKKIQVKIFRSPRLHAKAYIFGDLGDGNSVGIVGSSNFTKAGLTSNSELNFLTNDYKIVEFEPKTKRQENGHLTWFNDLWNSDDVIEWTGDFTNILQDSPLGNYTYGAYDIYIRTLMEVFPDELIETEPFDEYIENILHPFQNQNAMSLRRKLQNMGVAMLSDSVGLGKTITASAIIKQFLEVGLNNIVIIPPAALKRQWIDELQSERWNLVVDRDFRIISQQDGLRIQDLIEYHASKKNSRNQIDLFIIDEAHNLRNQGSTRYQQILQLFQENPRSKVLLLTATPINNSLMDFANQIQLGSKGDLVSRKVPYISNKGEKLEYIDFFEALKRIQDASKRANDRGEKFDWNHHKNTLTAGIRHYLVRSTRQGVIKRNAMKSINGSKQLFPRSKIEQISYKYSEQDVNQINNLLRETSGDLFEGLKPECLNLNYASEITQRTAHPIDIFKEISEKEKNGLKNFVIEKWRISEDYAEENLFLTETTILTVIPAVFKMINFLGFAPYRPDVYSHDIYNKSIEEIRALNIKGKEAHKLRVQMAIHNMLHVTWLKRLESSMFTLKKSVANYLERIALFEKWLNRGYLVSLTDASLLAKEYDEDIEKAFDDYEKYLIELDASILTGTEKEIMKRGIERKIASEAEYNISQLKIDLERDKAICNLLICQLECLVGEGIFDAKLEAFSEYIIQQIKSNKYGKKVLVFSFFSDTVDYLKETLSKKIGMQIKNFEKRVEFVSGNNTAIEDVAKRFSPISKKYKLKKTDFELDFLIATDVLSEGQNLQDAGILINYDLHWNPVRMIQRNGRINRLGSTFDEILISNVRPHADLELYLKLVRRLENKISTINNTVGNDQSILGEKENPIEFNDIIDEKIYSENSEEATIAMEKLENKGDLLDWVDSYSLELRNFIDSHKNDGEVKRLLKIPIGKWNYLPKKDDASSYLSRDGILGLFRAEGQYSSTGEKIKDIGFVRIDKFDQTRGPFSPVRTEYIQEQEALDLIRTDETDNQRQIDNISLDRSKYIEMGQTAITVHFETIKNTYSVKPSGNRALEVFETYINENLLHIIEKGIRFSNEKREFERIVRDVNRQVKENGSPHVSTVRKFEHLINKLLECEPLEKKLEKVEGVLFYAKPE